MRGEHGSQASMPIEPKNLFIQGVAIRDRHLDQYPPGHDDRGNNLDKTMASQRFDKATFQLGQTMPPLPVLYTGECLPRLSGKFLFQILISAIPILTMIKLTVKRQIIRLEFVQPLQLNLRPLDLQDKSPTKRIR